MAPSCVSQKLISPLRVEAAKYLPPGCIAIATTSCVCCRTSVAVFDPEYVSHNRTVLSQDELATVVLPAAPCFSLRESAILRDQSHACTKPWYTDSRVHLCADPASAKDPNFMTHQQQQVLLNHKNILGLNFKLLIGPSCPLKMSSSWPVRMLQTNI